MICGAGISVSSPANIPDFRSAHGLFKKLKEKHPTAGLSSGKDLFDARLFSSESTSALFYSMVAELKRLADEAEPTIFHRFLKRLDEEGRLQRVYTQNIDGLEEKAGLTFGLGEAGDSTTTVRALGKRKRASDWSRSKSDSALLFAQKQQETQQPMFPRTIPLHGTLQTLTCQLCNHKLILGNTVRQVTETSTSREGSASLGHEESKHAIELLQNGEPVPCPRCEEADGLRTVAGMRSRGVGRMKVDIVLYGGQNEGAERVGQCLQRDILGLRDPNEPPVPESVAETRARERKEKREADKLEQERLKLEVVKEDGSVDEEGMVESELGSLLGGNEGKDEILAMAFAEEGSSGSARSSVGPSILASQPASTGRSITIEEPVKAAKKKPQRPPRLKPLPPDLLIVAGTSLKVPGTKRIVREFAKACHAQDEWLIYDSEEEGDDSSANGDGPSEKRSEKPKKGEDKDEEDEEHEIHDPTCPIRTILLNYDFPNPAREWEDVFDVWIQGDLQRAALSLCPRKEVEEDAPEGLKAIEEIVQSHTWAKFKDYLEEQRKLAKLAEKEKKKAANAANGGGLGGRKGKVGRTVSAAAKMESSAPAVSQEVEKVVASSQVERGAKAAKARARSESPNKKQRTPAPNGNGVGGKKNGGGLKRSSSKKNPFIAVEIPAIKEEEEQGKGSDGGNRKRKEQSPSISDAPSNKRQWVRSRTLPEKQPELMVLLESTNSSNGNGVERGGKGKKGVSVQEVKPLAVYGSGKRAKRGWGRTLSETAAFI